MQNDVIWHAQAETQTINFKSQLNPSPKLESIHIKKKKRLESIKIHFQSSGTYSIAHTRIFHKKTKIR